MECIEGDRPRDGLAHVYLTVVGVLSTSVNAEYSIVNYHRKSEEIKHVGEVRPDVRRAVFPHTFCVESISLLI
jgi:1,4-dihydroxy-2-naphthoyl-CoA synthase